MVNGLQYQRCIFCRHPFFYWIIDFTIYKIRSSPSLKETLINLILNKLYLFIFKDSHCFHGKWIDIFQLLNLVFQMNICCNLWMKQAWLAIQITQCVIHLLVSIQLQLPRDGPVVTNVFLKKTTFLITKYKLMLNIN